MDHIGITLPRCPHSYSATTQRNDFPLTRLQCSIERLLNCNLTDATSIHAPHHCRRIVRLSGSRPLFIRREVRRRRRSDGPLLRPFCNRIALAMGLAQPTPSAAMLMTIKAVNGAVAES
jgi:hypothetical protein